MLSKKMVVLFDGVCTFCNGSVRFILKRDPHGRFMYTSLQSETGQKLLRDHGLSTEDLDTLVLIQGDRYYLRSDAALKIAGYMSGLWWLFSLFLVVPRPIRDFFYNLFAQNRYRMFGREDVCPIPTEEERSRFIDDEKDLEDQLAFSSADGTIPPPQRYHWPVKLLVFLIVFDMAFRSTVMLSEAPGEWVDDLKMQKYPAVSLPTQDEYRRIDEGKHDKYTSRWSRNWAAFKSAGAFLNPWPDEDTQEEIEDSEELGKYVLSWMVTRLDFIGHLFAVDQNWPMFSPDVNLERTETLGRLKLVFADGSSQIFRLDCDPVDLTWFGHWNAEKRLATACKVHRDWDSRFGYCNMLSYKYPKNEKGSPLKRIYVFRVHYKYPGPDDDAHEFLKAQSGPPADQVDPPFWYYDVETKRGYSIDEKEGSE